MAAASHLVDLAAAQSPAYPPLLPDALPADARSNQAVVARWALDVSPVRPLIERVALGEAPQNWREMLVAGVRIADVDANTVYLVGPHAGRARMIGQPISAYWPPESRPALTDLVMAAVADHPRRAPKARGITSLAVSGAVLRICTADGGRHPDIVFLSLEGELTDDRSRWSLLASDERYRSLIHHLPIPLLQVDSQAMIPLFESLRREGVRDIAACLRDAPALIEHAREIVMVTDANRNAVDLFAAPDAAALIGPVDYLFAASEECAMRVITAHFDGRRSHCEVTRLRRFDGEMRDVRISVTYPTPPERLDVTLISLEDVTDRLRTEAQLRQLQADYVRAARISMLGELATSIAHEVNQPLSAIVTNAETSLRWLSRGEPNLDKVRQLTARIAGSGRLASEIVQRIRGMAAQREPECVALDLDEVIEEAVLVVRHEIESRAIMLSVRPGAGVPNVVGDRVQLQQVIVNLLLNAVQALAQSGPPDGVIELATAVSQEGLVTLTVRDGGPGIAPADLDRVFDSFFTTKHDGMGIGLAICQSIIAAHGGSITASNHPDGGAIFAISLPTAARV